MTRIDEFVKPWPNSFMAGDNAILTDGNSVAAHIEGLMSWWALAGVENWVSEERVDWLRPAAPAAPVREAAAPATFPDTIADFQDWLARSADLPEQCWPGARVMPSGPAMPRLMVILPAPSGAASLMSAEEQRLAERMAASIGLSPADIHWASLSVVAPAGGMLDPGMVEPLAARMRHYIGLVAPAALLLFGDQTSRALVSATGGERDENLPFVNHSGGMLNAALVNHPRLLMQQPLAKAGVWRTLQQLARVWAQ